MKVVIVTGASSGLGREFVRQIESLYKELDEIWLIARREDRLLEVESRMMTKVRIFAADLRHREAFEKIGAALQECSPDVRMLVNAAGFGKVGEVEEISMTDHQADMVRVNCEGLTSMTCMVLPYMSVGSRIVNVASAAAFCPQPNFSVYAATKAYVKSFSDALGEEVKKRGIFVTAVCPGPVHTEFFEVARSNGSVRSAKDRFMKEPEVVVRQALIDAARGRKISVCGFSMKSARVAAKVLPQKIVLGALQHFGNESKEQVRK